jgi:hypothetical protein
MTELSAATVFCECSTGTRPVVFSRRIHKCRTKTQATAYLVVLKRYCDDRQAMYYAARRTVPDNQKHLAVAYMHKAQADCGRVQAMIERLGK